jgi:uncharacterized protein YcbX
MLVEIGEIAALFRYPVKSMAAERLRTADLGWHGVDGDRRLALRNVDERGAMPWLVASKFPELLLFTPVRRDESAHDSTPTHVRTPEGKELTAFGDELEAEVRRRHGATVQMMQLKHGIFDDSAVSVIATETVDEIGRLAGRTTDVRRFRPNVVVRSLHAGPFHEDRWLGGVLSFGEGAEAPAIAVTLRDERCSMVNLDPDSAQSAPEVMKAIVRANDNHAGIYGTVTRIGRLTVGVKVFLRTEDAH